LRDRQAAGTLRGVRVSLRAASAVLVASAAALVGPGVARAAEWCGSVSEQDRAPVLAGHPVRVLYAIPADGADRSAELAPRISADIDEIAAWWWVNDSSRMPRFDVFPFACGPQVDLTLKRLAATTAQLAPSAGRWDRILDELERSGSENEHAKFLVYYDAPVEDTRLCGQGGGFTDGGGAAVVYLQACASVSSASTAAHELLHTLGALAGASAPNSCPDSQAHVCDSTGDILYTFAQATSLSALVLDLNRDDYYAHGQRWFDVRDSAWLRNLDEQTPLALTVRGRGTVVSDVPGLTCAASCRTEWNPGTSLVLTATPAVGQRFVRWTGACTDEASDCGTTLDRPAFLTAFFAPARFRLTVAVAGGGRVNGAGAACALARCVRNVTSHRGLTLRATPAKGWRLRGWSGACRGAKPTCRVPMTQASSVRARFVRS
jgi:hypothetical protein